MIYEPKGKAREYSPLALNYFKGCDNNCLYCYVPPMMRRFRQKYDHRAVNSDIDFKKIEASAKKFQGCEKQILLSFTGDPYCNAEDGETRTVLEILNKYSHKVAILTKNPNKALKDIDVFKSFGERFKIGSTLTFSEDKESLEWESGAETSNKRVDALNSFSLLGIKTWASFEPVIDPLQSLILLEKVSAFISQVKIGKINNYKGLDKEIDWLFFLKESVEICRENDVPFYIKNDLYKFAEGTKITSEERDQDYLSL